MDLNDFLNRIRILKLLDGMDVGALRSHLINNFLHDPVDFLIRCDDESARIVWSAVELRAKRRTGA